MLSATGKGPPDTLVNSACEALGRRTPPVWPAVETERACYSSVATFLNNCVDVCNGALDGSKSATTRDSDSRLYDRIKFVVYDTTTEDGVEGAAPVKLDNVGGLDLEPDEHENPFTKQALLPIVVEVNWVPMVVHAAAHAHCLFSASPLRQFVVVLGFQCVKAELRFLVRTSSYPREVPFPVDIYLVFTSW